MVEVTGIKPRSQITSAVFSVMAVAMAVSPVSVPAQSNATTAGGLEEIVVTARRVEENLQEVPISITALTGFQLEDRMIRNMFDLPMVAPGLFTTIGATRGNAAPVFSIRGQANRNIQPGGDSSIGIYFADVPWARPEGANADLFDLESVQVLKGPQGTLFGRNSTGGAILLTPRAPAMNEFDGYVEASMGDYNMRAGEGVVNIPLTQDTLALRLGGQYRVRDGYMLMLNTGQKFSDVDAHSLRASLLWTPNEQITSTTIYSYFRSDVAADGTKVIDITPAPNSGTQAQFYPFAQQALALSQQSGKYEGYSAYTPDIMVFPPFTAANPGNGPLPYKIGRYIDTTANTIQNTTVWEFGELGFLGDVSFKNIIGYRKTEAYASSDNTGVPILTVVSFGSAAEIEQVSDEFQILGKKGAFDYVLGAFAFREYGDASSNTYQFNTNATSQDGWVKNASKSLFAHGTYDLSGIWLEGLSASAGARITKDSRELINRNYQQLANGTFRCRINLIVTPTRNPGVCSYPTSVSYSEPTWNIGLNYQFTADNMVYVSANRGYRSGGLQQGATSVVLSDAYLPEFVNNYEIGSKNNFQLGNMLGRLNVAVYYLDLTDTQKQINRFVEGGGVVSTLFNATSGSTTGVEVEFTLRPLEQLELGANYSYIDAKFDEYTDLVAGAGGVFYPVDISDSYFPYMSRNSASANATWTLPLDSRLGELSVNGSYSYRSSFITNTDISTANCFSPQDPNRTLYSQCYNRRGLLPGYSIVNLRVNWENLMGWGVDASFFVENLLNEYYYVYSSASYPNLTVNPAMPGEPRMFGVSVRVPFGAGAH